jgi:hypothetical protein
LGGPRAKKKFFFWVFFPGWGLEVKKPPWKRFRFLEKGFFGKGEKIYGKQFFFFRLQPLFDKGLENPWVF